MSTNKSIRITVNDKLPQSIEWGRYTIDANECPCIVSKYPNETLTVEKVNDAIDTVMAWMIHNKFHEVVVDVDIREKTLAQAIERDRVPMTINEIEHILGHKIKIVGGK